MVKVEIKNEIFLLNLLQHAKEVLDKHNIDYWLECGTLLGAIRDGKFIPWEQDIDLGTWSKNVSYSKKLAIKMDFLRKRFNVYIADSHMNIRKGEYCLDLNFYILSDEKAIVPLSKPTQLLGILLRLLYVSMIEPNHYELNFKTSRYKTAQSTFQILARITPSYFRDIITKVVLFISKKMHSQDVSWKVPLYFLSEFSTINFYNMEFKIPAKTNEYLAARYGNDWMVPRRNWITEKDDKCVVL